MYIYIYIISRKMWDWSPTSSAANINQLWPCAVPGREQRDRQMRGTRIAAAIGVLS